MEMDWYHWLAVSIVAFGFYLLSVGYVGKIAENRALEKSYYWQIEGWPLFVFKVCWPFMLLAGYILLTCEWIMVRGGAIAVSGKKRKGS